MQSPDTWSSADSLQAVPQWPLPHAIDRDELLLVRELVHRFNNELASMSGFVSLLAARSESDEAGMALASILQRIYDVSAVQRALQIPANDGAMNASQYLGNLCRSISNARLRYKDIELVFCEAPLTLGSSNCGLLGMIVSELICNAERHAFRGQGGKIEVELIDHGSMITCAVADNGCGVEKTAGGQGTAIIRSLALLLEGRVEYRREIGRTIALLSFPVTLQRNNEIAATG